MVPDRETAWQMFCRYNQSESLRRHALSVEGVMRHFAARFDEDAQLWGVVGLLHDIDYELYPEQHCVKAVELLEENAVSPEIIHAVVSHGWGLCSETKPENRMERVLYAVDELTGLITACAIMRPSGSVLDLEVKSVRKKYKSLNFAAGVNREVIERGAQMIPMELETLIAETILGMREVADEIGLGLRK